MFPFTILETRLLVTATIFLLGAICFLLGVYILLRRGYASEIQALASSTAELGQKGMAQEVAGLVSSASELVYAVNQLVRTSTGIGAFLMLIGLGLMGASFWALQQIASIPA